MRYLQTISVLFLLCLIVIPLRVLADELKVTPVVVDDKAKARDILKRSITIQNTSNRKLTIYPSVNDVHPADGKAPFISAQNSEDRSDSLANWIELSRGVVELNPGEEKTLPFVVRVAPSAVAGTYHAAIAFGEGGDRAAAEARSPLGTVTINVEVGEDVKEFLQLNKFITDHLFFSGDDVLFKYQLENIGNQELQPKGEIRIYDRRGEEVASVDVNPDGKKFSPDQQLQLASVWSAAHGFGKYKAFLSVDYGSGQAASVQDTVYFWIIPWQQLLALAIAALIAVVSLALYYHRWLEEQHRLKYGIALTPSAHVAAALGQGSESKEAKREAKKGVVERVFAVIPSTYHYLAEISSRRKSTTPVSIAGKSLRETLPKKIEPTAPTYIQQMERHIPPRGENLGEVIDLKKMRPRSMPQESSYGEVIDLKKRS